MNQKLISIVVPVYNVEEYLSRCLDSIINQTYKNIEIICVNDGSTDNSLKILTTYSELDYRIKIISQENQGLSEARNIGIKNSSGEYIGFIDSDDSIDENYFEVLYNNLIIHDADISCAKTRYIGFNDVVKYNIKKTVEREFGNKVKLFIHGSVCDKLYKKSLFEHPDIRFIKGRYFEDNIVTLQLAYYSKKLVIDDTVYYNYFFNEKSICNKKSCEAEKKRDTDTLFMVNTIINYFKDKELNERDIKEVKFFLVRALIPIWKKKKTDEYKEIYTLLGKKFILEYKIRTFFPKIFSRFKKFCNI